MNPESPLLQHKHFQHPPVFLPESLMRETRRQKALPLGIIGCAVGGPFAVLLAEQLFVSGCELLVSVTSAGQITPRRTPPHWVLIDRAMRDEGDFEKGEAAGTAALLRLVGVVARTWKQNRESEGSVAPIT
jgi:hypothetical protein